MLAKRTLKGSSVDTHVFLEVCAIIATVRTDATGKRFLASVRQKMAGQVVLVSSLVRTHVAVLKAQLLRVNLVKCSR